MSHSCLTDSLCWTGETNLRHVFLNEAIIDIIKECYFQGRKSLYQLFLEEFTQSLAMEDGGKGQEVPARLVVLVTTFVWLTNNPYIFNN